ncbi:MAG: M50 family metallopeptidase, partial [Bacilli bacterium]
MIIKSIFKIHFLFYVVSFICIITGLFKPFLIITILIVIHELGHLLMALYYGWKIDKIIIFPFGGVTKFNEKINKPIREEFLILIMGPIIQIIFYFLCDYFFGYNAMLEKYHYTLLIFNLLPIFPLDGSKLVHLFLEIFF